MPSTPDKPLKVLIVEDDKFLAKILVTKFTKEGFAVTAAEDGETALTKAAADVPDLVLLDLILPEMSGFEVLSELKGSAKTKRVPVIVLSNLSQDEDKQRTKDLGALEFLVKSDLSINDVVAKVKEIYVKNTLKA